MIPPSSNVEIKSPGHPNNYVNNLYCMWHVTVATNATIRIIINAVETQDGSDNIEVYDSDDLSNK